MRLLLQRLLAGIEAACAGAQQRDLARLALRETLERVELSRQEKSPALVLHYAVRTGDKLASPRGFEPL